MGHLIVKLVASSEEITVAQSIRRAVFQLEQGVPPDVDFDGQDETATQLIAYLDQQPVGTARIRYLDDYTAKIERLAVLPIGRGQGIGQKIMEKALDVAAKKNLKEVVIHAQKYIKCLHQKLGFAQEGEPFQEAGIPHIKMRKILKETLRNKKL